MAAAVRPRLDPGAVCRMVFASSLAFRRGSYDHIAYSAAKGGIVGLVRALARGLAPGVLVNGLAPGIILTAMPDHIIGDPARRERLLAETALKRFGEPREVATVIRFLLGEDFELHHRPGDQRRRRRGQLVSVHQTGTWSEGALAARSAASMPQVSSRSTACGESSR